MKEIRFDEDRTGVIVWPSSSEQVTIEKMSFISLNYYSWTSVFCYFFNLSDISSLYWISRCCDAVLIAEGFLEIDRDHVVYENRRKDQQSLIFSTGKVACNKCGLVSRIIDLVNATVEPTVFNKTLICSSRNKPWYFTIDLSNTTKPRTGNATGGFEFLLMEDVRNHLGFSYYIRESSGNQTWGAIKNGTWRGILSQLIYREAHFALGDLTILYPKNLYFDFTYPYDFDVLAFVSKLEVRVLSSLVFIQLMDAGSWISLLVLTTITCAFLVAACKLSDVRASMTAVVLRGVEYVYAALVQPSVEFPYRAGPGAEIVLLIWKTGIFVLGSALSASLVTFIATPGFEAVIDTMKEWASFLLSHRDSRICMTLANYQNFFEQSDDLVIPPEAAHIGKFVFRNCLKWSSPRIVNEIVMGTNGFWLGERVEMTAEFIEAGKGGGLARAHVSGQYLNIMHQGIVLQRGCAFSIVLQNVTRGLFETGHLIHYKKKLNMYDLPAVTADRTFSPLGLSNISGLVTSILALEAALILVLLVELALLFRRLRLSRQRNTECAIRRKRALDGDAFAGQNVSSSSASSSLSTFSLTIYSLKKSANDHHRNRFDYNFMVDGGISLSGKFPLKRFEEDS